MVVNLPWLCSHIHNEHNLCIFHRLFLPSVEKREVTRLDFFVLFHLYNVNLPDRSSQGKPGNSTYVKLDKNYETVINEIFD